MRHFINIFVFLIITGLGVLLAYWIHITPNVGPEQRPSTIGLLWFPWIVAFGFYLINKLDND